MRATGVLPWMAVAAFAACGLGLGLGCRRAPESGVGESPEAPSELFVASGRCAASGRAQRLERDGRMRNERYPYDPRDGIVAVRLFLEAAECYQARGRPTDAMRAAAAARRLESRITTDYAAARVALEHALERGTWSDARRHVRRLLSLTEHMTPHPYVDWLRDISARATSSDDE